MKDPEFIFQLDIIYSLTETMTQLVLTIHKE